MSDTNAGECLMCDKPAEERCGDNVCRECHVSLSFEDCLEGTWQARHMVRTGMWSLERARKEFPKARI